MLIDMLLGVSVAVTVYAEPYIGRPLAFGGTYTYTTPAWVAVPQARILDGTYAPFDLLVLHGIDRDGREWWYQGRVQDAGYLAGHCIEQAGGACWPIWFDLPQVYAPFPGLSARLTEVVNVSAMARKWQ